MQQKKIKQKRRKRRKKTMMYVSIKISCPNARVFYHTYFISVELRVMPYRAI
jgi:hypothetical protein